jgi:hypothetical protein
MDIFSGSNPDSLFQQVTEYAANYGDLAADIIRTLLPEDLRIDVRVDKVNGLRISSVTLGIDLVDYF